MQEGQGKRDLLPERHVQYPHQRKWHHEHDGTSHHVWNGHVALERNFIHTFPSAERLVPFVGNRCALEDCYEGGGDAGCNDDGSDNGGGNGKASFTSGEDTCVEQQDGAFADCYCDAVDGHPRD